MPDFVIVGLGNPGPRYAETRHNVGAIAVLGLAPGASWRKGFHSLYLSCEIAGRSTILLLPQTYMNESGRAVREATDYFSCLPEQLLVMHDDLDLPSGTIRVKRGGASGGHRGIDDTIRYLGSADFFRVRIGIGHPRDVLPPQALGEEAVKDWVLSRPTREEVALFDQALRSAADAARTLIAEGLDAAQRRFNRKANVATETGS